MVLAAGAGARFAASGGARPKVLAELDGVALVDRVLAAVVDAGLDPVVLVDGAVDLSDRAGGACTVLHNPGWSEGLAGSLLLAVSHVRATDHDAVVVGLADQPGISSDAWAAVAAAPDDPPLAVATYGGRRGHPVRIHRSAWDLLPVRGDRGASSLMRERPELVREVPCSGDPSDVDTLEDLERWS